MLLLIFEQLIKMFFIMLLAFLCYRVKIVSQEGNRSMSNLLLMVVNPCVILTVYQTAYDPELVRGLLLAFAAAAVSHILAVITATFLIRSAGRPDYSIERFSAVYSNCGFIGIPLIGSILGDTGIFYLTAYIVMFNLFSWTHGIMLMEKKFSVKGLKEGLLSPMFIATIAAVILFFLQIRIPGVLLDAMDYVADMNTPLAMMVAGFSVAQSDLGKMLRKVRLYFVCAIKLLIIPFLMIPVLMLMRLPQDVSVSMLIATACPAAVSGTMFAIRYKQDYTYASEIFALSTVLSIVTIPLVIMTAELLL